MKPLSNQQRLHQVNTEQLFENYRSAMHHAASYQYGMRWKTVRSKDYLFRENWGQIPIVLSWRAERGNPWIASCLAMT